MLKSTPIHHTAFLLYQHHPTVGSTVSLNMIFIYLVSVQSPLIPYQTTRVSVNGIGGVDELGAALWVLGKLLVVAEPAVL